MRLALLLIAVLIASCSTVHQTQPSALDEDLRSYLSYLLNRPDVYDRKTRTVTTDLRVQAYAAYEISRLSDEIPRKISRRRLIDAMASAAHHHALTSADTSFLSLAFGPEFCKEVKERLSHPRSQ